MGKEERMAGKKRGCPEKRVGVNSIFHIGKCFIPFSRSKQIREEKGGKEKKIGDGTNKGRNLRIGEIYP